MANEQNLIRFDQMDEEKRREYARRGGQASAESRKRKRVLKENLEILMSLPIKDKKARKVMKFLGIDDEDLTNDMAACVAMFQETLKGNVQAYKEIRDMLDGKPQENVKVEGNINTTNPLEGLSTEEIRKAIEMMSKGEE